MVGLYVNSPAALIDDCWDHFCIAGMEGGTEICNVKPNAVTFLLQLSLLYRSWWVGLHFINLLKNMSAKFCKTRTLQSRLYAKTLNHNPTLETFSFLALACVHLHAHKNHAIYSQLFVPSKISISGNALKNLTSFCHYRCSILCTLCLLLPSTGKLWEIIYLWYGISDLQTDEHHLGVLHGSL